MSGSGAMGAVRVIGENAHRQHAQPKQRTDATRLLQETGPEYHGYHH